MTNLQGWQPHFHGSLGFRFRLSDMMSFRGQHFARVVIVFWAGFETLRVPRMQTLWNGGGDLDAL